MIPWTISRKCCHMILLAWIWGSSSMFCSRIVTVCCQSSRLKRLRVSSRSFRSSSKLSDKSRSLSMQLWVNLTHPRAFKSAGNQHKVAFHYFNSSVVVWWLIFPRHEPSNRNFLSSSGINMTAEWILLNSLSKKYCTRNSTAGCRSCPMTFWKRTRRVLSEPCKYCK